MAAPDGRAGQGWDRGAGQGGAGQGSAGQVVVVEVVVVVRNTQGRAGRAGA